MWYEGQRNHDGTGPNRVDRVDASGRVALDPRLDVRNHSPTGFEWGYGGSGPAQLALALAIDALDGKDDALAVTVYQKVKWLLVAGLDGEAWSVTQDEILAVIDRINRDMIAEDEKHPRESDEDFEIRQMMDTSAEDVETMIQDEEAGVRTPPATCVIHGTQYAARLGGCPICIEEERRTDDEL
ncbi:MAG TPA: DUF6166 domain-containing protein [Gemmatimonadaceae bacterium]|nr:DUF6166 domain-containing protein [Gemmatimonadaceae bacterium]